MDLDLATSGTHTINAYNNFISDITSAYSGVASATRQIKGAVLGSSSATSVYNFDYNSVRIDGSSSPTISSVALEFGSSTPINNVRNNILSNFTEAQSGVAKHFAIRSVGAATFGAASSVSNYNDLYIDNTTNGFVGLTSSTDRATIADWTAAVATANPNTDVNSINVLPSFGGTIDLHISPSSSNVNGKGMPLSITTDIDGEARNATTPDLGADEYNVVAGIDVGISDLVAPILTGCYGSAQTIAVVLKNFASTTHDFTANPVTITVNVTGPTTLTTNIVVNTGTLGSGSVLQVTLPATVNMSASGTYTFNANTSVTGDLAAANDALTPAAIRVNDPLVGLPEKVNFTGFTGSNLTANFPNWREAKGESQPVGTISNWLSSTLLTSGTSARINLDATADREWLVGPKFTPAANTVLQFDVAITDDADVIADPDGGMNGTDDQVIVRISTDCGVTFTDLYAFNASTAGSISNTFVPQSISLSAYAGQNVIIAFFATEGTTNDVPDYDFHIDNINIFTQKPIDAGAIALVTPLLPPGIGCYTATENVTVTIRNYGSANLDFAATPLTVTTNVTGAVTTTLSAVLNAGTLAPDATMDVVMSSPLNMTAAGTYTFNASTSVAGDGDASNDAMASAVSRTNAPTVSVPQAVDFTGFTGTNLITLFPNWLEASGENAPAGTTSGWTSSTAITGSGTSAKINLTGNTDREWIVGPKFTATAVSRLKFKVAITNASTAAVDPDGMAGTDDEVVVKISTNCGLTWSDLQVFNSSNTPGIISNTLVEQTIPLDAYAGQPVIIAFYATEGTVNDVSDYDFHIDDINIESPPPVDLGAIALVTPLMPPGVGCYTATENVSVTIKNYGSSAIDFTVNPVTVTTNVTGAVTTTLTGVVNSGSLAPDATMDVVMSSPLNMTAAGTYTFNASTSVSGDALAANDAMTSTARTNAATVAIPQSVDFTGFTGTNLTTLFPNWSEATGATTPTGTTSGWTSSTLIAGSGTSARINLAGSTDREWLVGPKFTATASSRLKFKIAITEAASANADPEGMTGTDDQVIVKVSADCGLTWNDVTAFNDGNTTGIITNSLVEQNVSLGAYAGQTIIVAFFATEGTVDNTPSYDFHIDDINIENAAPIDMSAVTLVTPVQKTCFSNAETVTIRVKNNGTSTLDFATNPLTVNTNVTGAVTATLTATVSSGNLAPDATLDVAMSAPLDMTAAGNYTFNASTSIAGDGQTANDAMLPVDRTVVALAVGTASANTTSVCPGGIPQLTLAGHAGGGIQWQQSSVSNTGPWTNVGSGTATYIPAMASTTTMYYQAVVSCGSTSLTSNVVTVGYSNPTVLTTTPGARCGTGPVVLSATGSAGSTLRWYAALSGGTALGSGDNFTTPSLSSSGTYHVAAETGVNENVTSPAVGASTFHSNSTGWGLRFTVNSQTTINTVNMYPANTTAGAASIQVKITDLLDAVLYSGPVYNFTVGTTNALQVVPVNISLPPGDYKMGMTSTGINSLIRESTGVSFPYNSGSGSVSITAGANGVGSAQTTSAYYWFYNWSVTSGCLSNRVAVAATVNPVTTLAATTGGPQVCDVQNVSDNMYTDNSCGMIAKVTPSGAVPVSGSVSSCVKIDATVQSYNGTPYVQRHFDIEPATNPSTATATVTFYALQAEFDAYNSNNGTYPDLPTGPSDNAGIANLRITQFHGTGSAPGNYSGPARLHNPADANVVWNAANSWWEITVPVVGFSGFYIHTVVGEAPLPANLLTFSGSRQGGFNHLKWTVAQENDVLLYEVERSENGRDWNAVGSVNSLGNTASQRSYSFNDNNLSGSKQLYRLRQVDVNGSNKLSHIITISGGRPSVLTLVGVFPNPAAATLNVLVNAPASDNITIAVMDAVGRVVKTQKNGVDAGSNTLQVNLSGLAQGAYLVKVTCDSNCDAAATRFVKE